MALQFAVFIIVGVAEISGFISIPRQGCGTGPCQGQPLPGIWQPKPIFPCGPSPCPPNPWGQPNIPPGFPVKPYGWQYKGKTTTTSTTQTTTTTQATPTSCIDANGICTATCTIGTFTEQSDLSCEGNAGVCCVQPSG